MRKIDNQLFFGKIVQGSDVPLYFQLLSIIKREIKVGLIKAGDILPSEAELCANYNISRSTVRHAIGELESEGLVVRRRGKGTFISEPKLDRKMEEVYSFTKEMRSLGLKPSSKILDFQRISAQMDLSKSLEMMEGSDNAYKIVRVRLANEEPLLIETTFIPVHIIPGLTREMLTDESLYEVIGTRTGNTPYEAEESYESIILDREAANVLGCKQNTSGFYIERKTWMQDSTVFELTQSIMRGDRTKFVIKLKNKGIVFNRSIDGK
jgi:GntR family transcriptional regulator